MNYDMSWSKYFNIVFPRNDLFVQPLLNNCFENTTFLHIVLCLKFTKSWKEECIKLNAWLIFNGYWKKSLSHVCWNNSHYYSLIAQKRLPLYQPQPYLRESDVTCELIGYFELSLQNLIYKVDVCGIKNILGIQ